MTTKEKLIICPRCGLSDADGWVKKNPAHDAPKYVCNHCYDEFEFGKRRTLTRKELEEFNGITKRMLELGLLLSRDAKITDIKYFIFDGDHPDDLLIGIKDDAPPHLKKNFHVLLEKGDE